MEYRINHLRPPKSWRWSWPTPSLDFWEAEYGFVDYEGKEVMDVGADWGRTADYFLQKGAKKVIAVEGNPILYVILVENAKFLPGMIPVFLPILHLDDFVNLIKRWSIDLMQVDCEGCEALLFQVPDEIFSRIPEYLIETHSSQIHALIKRKCRANKYTIIEDRLGRLPQLRILYAVRPQYIY